ncbi:MAG: hypothetical protein ACR2M4_10670 [Actinomycetota bacterium]
METAWLKAQLKRSDTMTPSVQGLREVREFAGVATDLRAAFDPAKGAASAAQLANDQLAERAQFWRLSQSELEARRAFETARANAGAPTAAAADRTPGSLSAPTLPGAPTPIPATLPSETPRKSTAQESEIDMLSDQIAFRNTVNATLKDVQLDDTHDQFGSALYEMLFDITVVPGDKSHEFAKITMNIGLPTSEDADGKPKSKQTGSTPSPTRLCRADSSSRAAQLCRLYDRWIFGLADMLNEDLQRLWQRARSRELSTSESEMIERYTQGSWANSRRAPDSERPSTVRMLREEYATALVGFAKITDDGNTIKVEPLLEPQEGCSDQDGGVCRFVKWLQTYERHRMNAFRVDPREHAQNISEVRAREMVASATAAVQAALAPQGANADASLQAIRKSQETVDAIGRQPLAVGFSQGRKEFGWILGPRFTIPAEQWWLPSLFGVKSAAEYLHIPARYTFSAVVIAPAWLTQLCVRGSYAWVDADGDEHRGQKFFAHGSQASARCADGTMVFLPAPADITRSITRGLVNFAGRETKTRLLALRPSPKITFPAGRNCKEEPGGISGLITLSANSGAQTLLIRGEEVWRSPEVYVGSQPADEVRLLPDMKGLEAKFTQVSVPPGADPRYPTVVDLRVITSFGEDCVRDAVRIVQPPASSTTRPST